MMTRRHLWRRTIPRGPLRDTRGVAALEFAILAPFILTLTLGIIEIGFVMMIDASLEMAIRQASRYGMITPDDKAADRDERIREIFDDWIGRWLPKPYTIDVDVLTYGAFDNIGEPEPFTDANNNGTWDAGETYTDVNKDGVWSSDMGRAEAGGREEIVLYEVSFSRRTLTGIPTWVGIDAWQFSRRTAVQNE